MFGFIASNTPVNTNRILSGYGSLGTIPTDGDLAMNYAYTPVEAGWTQYGFNGALGPLGIAEAQQAVMENNQDRLDRLVQFQARASMFQVVSTVAVSVVAIVAIVNLFKAK